MTGHKSNAPRQQQLQHPRKPRPEKRQPLTHFLCIPLVNPDSLPQLEASVRTFRKDYPPIPVADLPQSHDPSSNDHVSQPLIPEGAIRPLGTLHLTLGVMSLSTSERLDQALNFFRSLDLASLMHEAERIAIQKREGHTSRHLSSQNPPQLTMQPLTASLESLHALPRAKAATILHAAPVDSTDRLHPFCLALRDKFLEAGFLIAEIEKPSKSSQTQNKKTDGKQADSQPHSTIKSQGGSSQHPERETPSSSQKSSHHDVSATSAPKLRPLLLHTTIANTIYVRGRPRPPQGPSHAPRDKNVQKRIVIDAREALARYSDYHVDVEKTGSHHHASSSSSSSTPHTAGSVPARPRQPFVWAKDIPIDSVCICEMGARKLATNGSDRRKNEWNKRLGEKYLPVAQRSILGS
ncbi:hypothetical protein N7478_007815 [Penicillium angulare]|uniref:uncharacterized protein n=1 Tax=Penicillium angulare TaxID=116970 RepID=UPI002540DA6A|nr:uncharacterized protein N7478_007815 [Penicillium angulare]KAJ5272690.1 hypothetical protein N7478_007815 [Penicillium angulare]